MLVLRNESPPILYPGLSAETIKVRKRYRYLPISCYRSDMVAGQIEKTRSVLDHIATGVNEISEFNHQFAVAIEEQANVAETISSLVEQINVYSVGSVELSVSH